MDSNFLIHTERTECQDCYKCVRHCPVKAIKIEAGHASVMPDFCVACGTCVRVCPNKAKRIRGDVHLAERLVSDGERVMVSLAPSWVSAFPGVDLPTMGAALERLGFAGAEETALGAQQVSANVAQLLREGEPRMLISTACPVAVSFILKYTPAYSAALTPLLSPALTHCHMMRRRRGDIKVVFIGPCAAKKSEAAGRPDLLDIALTFDELRAWFDKSGIDLKSFGGAPVGPDFFRDRAEEGALYPVDGGMIETVKAHDGLDGVEHVSISGLLNIDRMLDMEPGQVARPVFIETLACEGGCVNGPGSCGSPCGLRARMAVIESAPRSTSARSRRPDAEIAAAAPPSPAPRATPSDAEIVRALESVGKHSVKDELNCGGCGYESCRAFAAALLSGKAEPAMCVSFMRKQALKKANALLRCMPSGVVLVGPDLRVIESNRRFAALFGEDALTVYDASPGMAGADIRRIVPFADLFSAVLRTGEDLVKNSYHVGDRLYDLSFFNIEPRMVVGAIVDDVTLTQCRREQIARRAREVIKKNLAVVQEIASSLGEHMADTEIILRSIAEDYADKDFHEDGKE